MIHNKNKHKYYALYMKKNITVVYPRIKGNSGTRSYVENTFNGLDRIGVQYNKIGITKREISVNGKPYFGILFQYLSALTKSGKSKIVHALSPDVVIKGTNIVTIHDIIPFTNSEIYMKSIYDKLAYKLSFSRSLKIDNILISTEVGRKVFLDHTKIPEERVKVVHHSIDHSKFFPETTDPYPDKNKINIVMVSDFNPRKRIDLIIDTVGGDDEINFYHIGPTQGWSDRYSSLLKISRKFSNVKFLGPLDYKLMREYITFADLFVFLSESEGFGLPPLEAMACGTNTLVNDLPVFHETLGDKAFFSNLTKFEKNDILNAINKKKSRSELINYSLRFSISEYANNLNDIYNLELTR